MRIFFRLVVCRYVDDYFGVTRSSQLAPSRVMGVVFSALGFGVDPDKSEDFMSVLVILGAKLTIRWTKKALSLGLDDGKMRRWMAELDQVLLVGVLTPALAMKFVGRFLWAASLTADKVGRSNLKALMAQIHDPTRGYKLSTWARRSLVFWRKFLLSQPQIWKSVDECKRQHMISWTDAAGTGELAALLYDQRRDTFVYTTLTCPPVIMDQWLRRGDDYIGLLELVAVVMCLHTWRAELHNKLWTTWQDNAGVMHAVAKGGTSGVLHDANEILNMLWLDVHHNQTGLFVAKVESEANIADEPTREITDIFASLEATWTAPKLPQWLLQLWAVRPQAVSFRGEDEPPVSME